MPPNTKSKLPPLNETGKGGLPQTESRTSAYQNFSAALNKAVSLARGQRQSAELDLLGKSIKPGSVSASSFTSILGDLNTASDRFTQPLVTDALEVAKMDEADRQSIRDLALTLVEQDAKPEVIQGILALANGETPDIGAAISMAAGSLNATSKMEVRSVGRSLVQVDPTTGETRVLYTAPSDGGGGSEAGTGFFNSGGLRIDRADIGEGSRMLADTRGDDGFVNTSQYIQMYQHWVDNGGLPQDFFNQYDPDFYLNPNDPTVPTYIKSQMEKAQQNTNPFGKPQ